MQQHCKQRHSFFGRVAAKAQGNAAPWSRTSPKLLELGLYAERLRQLRQEYDPPEVGLGSVLEICQGPTKGSVLGKKGTVLEQESPPFLVALP